MFNKKISILIVSLFVGVSFLQAQLDDLGKFFAGGAEDAQKLFESYMGPYFNAFGTSLTGGWYNTAEPHKLGGFDITATFNTAIVPTSDRNFDLSQIGLESLQPGSESVTPTIAGDNSGGKTLNYNLGGFTGPAFDMPNGTGFPYIPSPMLQVGLGLIKDTEINGRYMPNINSGGMQIGMWGIGGKHGLKQWIPFIKKIPVLHLTLQYGYTKMKANGGMSVTPASINASDQTTTASWDGQSMDIITQSHTGNLLISANLPVVCFYGGIGFATTKTNLDLKGDFPVIDPSVITGLAVTDDSFLTNPLNVEIKNSDGSKTKPRYNIGVRFKFAVVTLHFDYTYANYSMASGGLGISFR